MRVGILFTAYNCSETLSSSILPWVEARDCGLDGHVFSISAVSVPFAEYKDIGIKDDGTTKYLAGALEKSMIDALVSEPQFITEADARNLALTRLVGNDIIILVDGDELYTPKNISDILKFILLDRWITWFSFSFKNYVFDGKTYLLQPFTPPRAFRMQSNGHSLEKFNWDNDVYYKHHLSGQLVDFKLLPTKAVPQNVAWIKHLTWLNNEKSKAKVQYQLKHFNGVCGYSWNQEKNCLEFNSTLPLPITAIDSDDYTKTL